MGYYANAIAGSLSVATSDLDVIREGFKAMKPEARRDPARRDVRRDFYRELIAAHHTNQITYQAIAQTIATGRLEPTSCGCGCGAEW